ncbi:hypothetical protein BDR07DRAFT_1393852 [Suillus spraguei]|nr:hypothetical protein BDR07DRAFT_1441281 [Suillus spraguei]KAG2367176.1 hypothetical protein BDR07DRAFT_1393852 [Suillus spraguei]
MSVFAFRLSKTTRSQLSQTRPLILIIGVPVGVLSTGPGLMRLLVTTGMAVTGI